MQFKGAMQNSKFRPILIRLHDMAMSDGLAGLKRSYQFLFYFPCLCHIYFTLLAYAPEQIRRPHSTYMFHCTVVAVDI